MLTKYSIDWCTMLPAWIAGMHLAWCAIRYTSSKSPNQGHLFSTSSMCSSFPLTSFLRCTRVTFISSLTYLVHPFATPSWGSSCFMHRTYCPPDFHHTSLLPSWFTLENEVFWYMLSVQIDCIHLKGNYWLLCEEFVLFEFFSGFFQAHLFSLPAFFGSAPWSIVLSLEPSDPAHIHMYL